MKTIKCHFCGLPMEASEKKRNYHICPPQQQPIQTTLEQKVKQLTQETFSKATVLCNKLEQEGHNRHALDFIHVFSSLRTLINELRDEVEYQRGLADLLRSRVSLWENSHSVNCPECYRRNSLGEVLKLEPCKFTYGLRSIIKFCPVCGWNERKN